MKYWFRRRLKIEDKGMAAIEFALVLPILMSMLAAIYDLSNLVLCENKVNQTAQVLSNVITRGPVTQAQLNNILAATPLLMQPFKFSGNGKVIVSCVTQASKAGSLPPPTLAWPAVTYGTGPGASKINLRSLPGGLVLTSGQTIIFTEVYYNYVGVFTGYSFTSLDVYQVAASVPRQGNMATPPT